MTVDYIRLSPTGNITVLVTGPVPREQQPRTAARLLESDCVGGEQAGFIEPPADPRAAARLQMMGGEFCGNAAMSLAAVLARRDGLAAGRCEEYLLEVSGAPDLVPCSVRRDGDGWTGTVRMPLPTGLGEIDIDTDGGPLRVPIVEMPGISHLILPIRANLREDELRRRIPEWNRALGADALGALGWDEAAAAIDPLVYVPSAGTLVREHGCGSGTAAIGCWLARLAGRGVEVGIRQPGGTITGRAEVAGHAVTGLSITGRVQILDEGTASVEG